MAADELHESMHPTDIKRIYHCNIIAIRPGLIFKVNVRCECVDEVGVSCAPPRSWHCQCEGSSIITAPWDSCQTPTEGVLWSACSPASMPRSGEIARFLLDLEVLLRLGNKLSSTILSSIYHIHIRKVYFVCLCVQIFLYLFMFARIHWKQSWYNILYIIFCMDICMLFTYLAYSLF